MTSDTLSAVISFLIGYIGIGLLVSVHELGHYVTARKCGIKVESVSFGFGPKIYQWQKHDTLFKICIIPIGGSTKLAGRKDLLNSLYKQEKHVESNEEGSLYGTKPWKRIITYLSGPLSNFLFAVLCYTLMLVIPTVTRVLPAKILLTSDSSEYSGSVCAAGEAGLISGDTVTAINGLEVKDFFEMRNMLIAAANDESVEISTVRGTFTVYPVDHQFGILPFGQYENKAIKGMNLFKAIRLSFKECLLDTRNFILSLEKLFSGKKKMSETIGGTFYTSEVLGQMTASSFKSSFNLGIRTVLYLMATVSVSLGFANMLPITALDGGLILISLVEMITKKTWSPKVYISLQILGLSVIFVIIPVIRFLF